MEKIKLTEEEIEDAKEYAKNTLPDSTKFHTECHTYYLEDVENAIQNFKRKHPKAYEDGCVTITIGCDDVDVSIPTIEFEFDQESSYEEYLEQVLKDRLNQKRRDYKEYLKLKEIFEG
jgi:hypothetical protein